jgi:Na+/proline symporter
MFGLHIFDFLAITAFLGGITVVGLWTRGRVGSFGDFAMPRSFGKVMMVFFSFGTGTNPEHAVAVAAKSFTHGISGIWYGWMSLFATPFYWIIAPVFRRLRAFTTGDVYAARFGPRFAWFYSFVGFVKSIFSIGVSLKGGAVMLTAISGGTISGDLAIFVLTALFVLYGTAGGLSAAIVTDLVQGIMTILYSFALVPLILHAVGGLAGVKAAVSDPDFFRLFSHGDLNWFFVLMLSLVNLLHVVGAPHIMGNCAAGRTEMDGAVGFMVGSFVKRICTIAWSLVGLAAVARFAGGAIDPEETYGLVARELLPLVGPGFLGLFLAGLMANMMSTCSALMVSASTLFTQNLYRPLRPGRDSRHYLRVVRWSSVATVAGSMAFAYLLPGFIAGVEAYWKLSSIIGLALLLGLIWRGLTPAGAWAATLAAYGTWWLTTLPWFVAAITASPLARSLGVVVQGRAPAVGLAWQVFFYLTSGVIAAVLVSRWSRPLAREKLDTFYGLMRTPVTPGEIVAEPCTLPVGAVVPAPRHLFPGTSLELLVPSRQIALGFLAGWMAVAALIGFVLWLMQ